MSARLCVFVRMCACVFCVYTYVCFVLYRFVAAEPDSILLRFDIRAPRSRRIIFQGGGRGDSLSPSSAFENKKGRTRASSCFSLSINFLFFLSSFLSSFVVRPRSGTAVVVSQCVRKKCHVVLFFSSGKEGQILVYFRIYPGEFIVFRRSGALCLCYFRSSFLCHSLPLSDIFLSFSLSLPPSSFLCFHLLSYCFSFLSFLLFSLHFSFFHPTFMVLRRPHLNYASREM